jgi:TonB family protein
MSQTLPRIVLLSAVLAVTPVASLCAQKIVPSSGSNAVTDAIQMKLVLQQVPPEYPYEARRSRITGHGILFGRVDPRTGIVTSVKMEKSTGNTLLDQAALNAFRQWRFKPGTVRQFRTPINFTMPR